MSGDQEIYNIMQYTNKNTTNYLFRFLNSHKFNGAFNGRLIARGVQ